MLSQKGFLNTGLIFIKCLYQICCMSSSLECGRQHSLTSCIWKWQHSEFECEVSNELLDCHRCLLTFPIRYQQISTFGQDTIRHFHKNASAMKRLGTRDFEDLLQVHPFPSLIKLSKILTVYYKCAIPVFEASGKCEIA